MLPFCAAAILSLSNARLAWPPKLPGRQCAEAVRALTAAPTSIVVDANNVRGATAFRLSKPRLTELCEGWAQRNGLCSRVIIVWDHGQEPQSLELNGVAHAFAGPRQSADDVIADQVVPALLAGGKDERVCVVTTDRGLIYRTKHEAGATGAPKGALKLLGTRKFVALLFNGAAADADNDGGSSAAGGGSRAVIAPEQAIARDEYARSDASVRAFASSLRTLRRHERRRRRQPTSPFSASFVAPYSERTWQRVLMAEKLRRRLVKESRREDGSERALLVGAALRDAAERRARRGAPAPAQGSEALLSDCRLDAKQRALLLRYGGALSDGSLHVRRAEQQQQSELWSQPSLAAKGRPTKRQRREVQRQARAARAAAGAGDASTQAATARRSEDAAWARQQQLEGLERWLADDPSLYADPAAE